MRNTSVAITMEKVSISHVRADGQVVWQSGFSISPATMGSTHSLPMGHVAMHPQGGPFCATRP